jgi:hypothetical protein
MEESGMGENDKEQSRKVNVCVKKYGKMQDYKKVNKYIRK